MKRSEILLILGRKGSGKSFHAKRLVQKRKGFIAVWDARSEWAGPTAQDAPKIGALLVRNLRAFLELQSTRRRPLARVLVFQCPAQDFPTWCRWVLARGDMLAVVDELHLFAGPHDSPEKSGAFIELIRVSRHARVDVLGIAQRPKSIHGDVRAQADHLIAFACSEPGDLAYFSEMVNKDFASALATLKPQQYREHRT